MLLNMLWLTVPVYVIVQVAVLWNSSGRARLAAGAPLIIMAPVFALAIAGLIQASNLWPLLLLLTSPAALLYVAMSAFAIHRRARRTRVENDPGPRTLAADA